MQANDLVDLQKNSRLAISVVETESAIRVDRIIDEYERNRYKQNDSEEYKLELHRIKNEINVEARWRLGGV